MQSRHNTPRKSRQLTLATALIAFACSTSAFAADTPDADLKTQIQELQSKVSQLQSQQNENWLTTERANQIKSLVKEVIADSKTRGSDGPSVGYDNGFFIQNSDKSFKLVIGGFVQARYEFAQHNAYNGRRIPSRTIATGVTTTPSDPINSNGFDIRRARVSFSGNAFSPDITFKMEGDFYGGSGGSFTVSDAFVGYRYSDLLKVKVGAFKVPFAKVELTSDTALSLMERPEVSAPFDPVRALGVSLYGDIIKDKFAYDINVNDGSRSNTLRQVDASGITPNLDNRLAFYARLQYAGAGNLKDFTDEADFRKGTASNEFIWMLGGAAGYESQNSTNNGMSSPQTTTTANGLSTNNSAGFTNYTLNGDIFRGTLDWSAKYQGWSVVTAAYFQQINANPGNTSSTSSTSISTGPTGYGAAKSSFFQHAYYGQVGYMVVPQKLELIGRAGFLLTEGAPNIGEFYTLGAAYYLYGNSVKLSSDITYSPEAAYTDASASLLQNTSNLSYRLQLQVKF